MQQKFEVAVNLAQDFTDAQKAQGRSNLGITDISLDGCVQVNMAQDFTDAQKAQGRSNLGITDISLDGCVQVNMAQTFTDAQKAQARSNIGAAEAPVQTINRGTRQSTASVSVAAVYNWVSGNILQVDRDTQASAKPVTSAEQAQGYKDLIFTLGTETYPATSFINVVITKHNSSDITVSPNPQTFYKGIEVYLGNADTPALFLIRKLNTAYSALDDRGVTVQEALSSGDLHHIPIWNCTLAGFQNLSVCDRICVRFIFDDNTTFGAEPKLSASIFATVIRDPTIFNYN